MPERTNAFVPLLAAFAVLGMFYAFIAYRLVHVSEGHLVYALDDAYIHMAIAKNVALNHVWGVQAGSYSASSSSPLWTLLLAAWFRLFGISDVVPLIVNTTLAL